MKRRGFLAAAGAAPALLLAPRIGFAHAGRHGLFAHGVASGDPLHDRVILCTHVSLPRGHGAVEVSWAVAEDAEFRRVVAHGSSAGEPARDYCIKVDAEGLAPGRRYFYRFEALGQQSMVGRTRTLPEGGVERLAFAVASCSNYPAGRFTAYRDIADQDDLAAVVHLGDYIYEYAADGYASHRSQEFGRVSVPGHELVTLDDYRLRHAQYKSDPDSIAMHAAHPLIAVWDDHEVANDAGLSGAQNHQPDIEGDWTVGRRNAWRAYDEWMPTRTPGLADNGRLFRSFDFGDLASLVMLDTRYFGRDLQVDALKHMDDPETLERIRRDPNRDLLGREQSAWLARTLAASRPHVRPRRSPLASRRPSRSARRGRSRSQAAGVGASRIRWTGIEIVLKVVSPTFRAASGLNPLRDASFAGRFLSGQFPAFGSGRPYCGSRGTCVESELIRKYDYSMKKITATDLARNLRAVLDRINETGEEYVVERGRRPVARVSPSPGLLSADEAMADLYRTISPEAAEGWIDDARRGEALLSNELRNPWDS